MPRKAYNILIISIFVVSLGFLFCSKKNDLSYQSDNAITPYKKITSLNDTLFFDQVYSMCYNSGYLYFPETKNKRVLKFSIGPKPKLVRIFGCQGQGPGEVMRTDYIVVKNSNLYIEDISEIDIFSVDTGWVKCTGKLPKGCHSPLLQFGVNSKGEFYKYITSAVGDAIGMLNKNGELIKKFGKYFPVQTGRKKYLANKRLITVTSNDEIVAVAQQQAIIEKYSPAGDLISRIDLRETNHAVQRTDYFCQYIFKKELLPQGKTNVTILNIFQIQVLDDVLYFIFNGYDSVKRSNSPYSMFDIDMERYLIAVDISGNKMREKKMFSLPKTNFSGFSFQVLPGNEVVIFNEITYALEFYKLDL